MGEVTKGATIRRVVLKKRQGLIELNSEYPMYGDSGIGTAVAKKGHAPANYRAADRYTGARTAREEAAASTAGRPSLRGHRRRVCHMLGEGQHRKEQAA